MSLGQTCLFIVSDKTIVSVYAQDENLKMLPRENEQPSACRVIEKGIRGMVHFGRRLQDFVIAELATQILQGIYRNVVLSKNKISNRCAVKSGIEHA